MITNISGILLKLLIVIIIIILFLIINKYLYNNLETFDTPTETEQITYTKLNETYIEPNNKTLDILYTNYSGEEIGKDIWTGKTLDQCTETCNKMENCIGFSRDAILDTEPGNCYPRSEISNCHSNRKGNPSQIQNAIKFNSYFKSNMTNKKQLWKNMCIGDTDMTLNRTIFIKSYAMPTKYIGNMGGDNSVVLVDKNDNNFKQYCNFRIEIGKDGIGTVSFLHINTNKYLYRDSNGALIVKDISSGKTIDKQSVSFNIYDGISQSIMLHPMEYDGETTQKFVIANNINNYLNVDILDSGSSGNQNNTDPEQKRQLAMFYIVNTIMESKIISGKNTVPNTINNTIENFDVNLDNSKNIPVYYNLFNTPDYINIDNYLNDNYNKNIKNGLISASIDKKTNDIYIQKEMSQSITKNEDEYNGLNDLNNEIENQIYNLTHNMNNSNDIIVNKMDKLKLTDMANDYFFLKFMNK